MKREKPDYFFALLVAGLGRLAAKWRESAETIGLNRFGGAERPYGSLLDDPDRKHMAADTRVYNVLFLCTHNSARSIMAEAYLNSLAVSRGRFKAFSAGSMPSGKPNPYALAQIESAGLSSAGLRSKDWNEFAAPGAPRLDFVFTVCDNAAKEVCPVWPGQPMTAHWGLADPSLVEGSEEEKRRAFATTFVFLANRINMFTSLPIEKVDRLSLQQKLQDIGKTPT